MPKIITYNDVAMKFVRTNNLGFSPVYSCEPSKLMEYKWTRIEIDVNAVIDATMDQKQTADALLVPHRRLVIRDLQDREILVVPADGEPHDINGGPKPLTVEFGQDLSRSLYSCRWCCECFVKDRGFIDDALRKSQ
jgi:hypothetical protein